MKNYNGELGNIVSRNSVGPTSVFVINEHISLHKSSPESIINHSITVKSGFNQFERKPGEKHGNKSASSTVACGVIELCDINCQKSLSLAGAEI
jgi:Cu/Zn superoxide dismutase